MNIRLALLRLYLPQFIRKRKFLELFGITARAFGMDAPQLGHIHLRLGLEIYARFTRERAESAIRQGCDLRILEDRLFQGALEMGKKMRRQLRISTPEEFMEVSSLLYASLGIDFRGTAQGDIVIRKCFFSSFYSPEVCRLISFLDAGIAAGLSGGGELTFSQRFTEGGKCCRAHIAFPENAP